MCVVFAQSCILHVLILLGPMLHGEMSCRLILAPPGLIFFWKLEMEETFPSLFKTNLNSLVGSHRIHGVDGCFYYLFVFIHLGNVLHTLITGGQVVLLKAWGEPVGLQMLKDDVKRFALLCNFDE